MAAIGQYIPLPAGRMLGRFLGRLAWNVLRRYRIKALAHIAIAFPDWPEWRREETIRQMFDHFGESFFELLWLRSLTPSGLAETTIIEGADNLRAALALGKGAIGITGHCGNWEWCAATIGSIAPMTVLQRERDEAKLNAFITDFRAGFGIETIDRGSGSSARAMFQALRRNRLLAFLLDQNIRAESVKVPFFGRPALTPIGPARIAIRAGAPIVPLFIERLAGGRQLVTFHEPIATTRDDDPEELTARLTAIIEAQIRHAPAQWVWMHERWRDRH
jgi:KDO2-lipid IV(A) lauroyltransferase